MMNIARFTPLAALAMALLAAGCCTKANGTATGPKSLLVAYAAEITRPETGPSNPVAPTTKPATAPATSPTDDTVADEESDETAWKIITKTLERDGTRKDAVLVVTVPRDDLFVAIDGMDVPTAAGVESIFNFWHCSCGKTSVIGQFCVADYESNDVIDALRAGHMEVASIGPMVLHSRVSPLLLRFQGEGKAADVAKTLREALRWTGKERMAPDVPDPAKK
jgi:hypothetical protein